MPRVYRAILTTCVMLLFPLVAPAVGLRVMTYNTLNFRGQADSDRYAAFRMILRAIDPDVVAMQEISDENGADHMLSDVFLSLNSDWAAAPFTDYSNDTESALFYRPSRVQWISQVALPTEPRYVMEYVLQPVGSDSTARFRVLSAHLKASQGSNNVERRRQAAVIVRQRLDQLPDGSLFLMCGDFNLYGASEPAYQVLISPGSDPDGQLFDPINRYGEWHNSVGFADVHTQSPRVNSHGGGATGGLDDRFDFILVSSAFMDTVDSRVLPGTYTPFGNDGRHYQQAVNDGVNYAVPDSVADALEWASDHLPVYVDFEFDPVMNTSILPLIPQRPDLMRCYPNPFNATLNIEIAPRLEAGNLSVVDLCGRTVERSQVDPSGDRRVIQISFRDHSSGTYFVVLESQSVSEIKTVVLSK